MQDLLDTAAAWLAVMNRKHRARMVTYVRAGLLVQAVATLGKSDFDVPGDYGLPERIEARDYFLSVSDLQAFGEPQPGDRIHDTLNSRTEIFEVMAPANRPHFVYDDYRRTYRIHTKHVGTST
jgi:hypothetical protein